MDESADQSSRVALDALRLERGSRMGRLMVRGSADDAAFRAACERALGVPLPAPGRSAGLPEEGRLFWFGRDAWLVVSAVEPRAALEAALRNAFRGIPAAVIDVSAAWVSARLEGPATRDFLAKGCALDLDGPAFAPGHCARTRLGPFSILLYQIDDVPTFELHVERSYEQAAWPWLEDAAREFGEWKP